MCMGMAFDGRLLSSSYEMNHADVSYYESPLLQNCSEVQY